MLDGMPADGTIAREESSVARMRAKAVDPRFSLAAHLGKTLGIAALILALGVWLARGASPWVWLAVPGFWIVANVFEWTMHRYPMHRPLQPRMLYRNHAIVHHKAFDGDEQEIAGVVELSVVMMPWYTLLIVFALASPIAVTAALLGGQALAGVFLVAAVVYFLVYETIHTLHHLPRRVLDRYTWGRWRALAALRRHHHHHHRLDRMTKHNFNVTLPLADWLLGTLARPDR